MTLELNLAQVEEILMVLENTPLEPDTRKVLSIIKEAIKQETELQFNYVDQLLVKIKENGYKDFEMLETFNKLHENIRVESKKTRDRYFDEKGDEKPFKK
tara:strand:+ start:243 stop:542 length:300 start_codon:yes stop_codon:yes gene_type:complete